MKEKVIEDGLRGDFPSVRHECVGALGSLQSLAIDPVAKWMKREAVDRDEMAALPIDEVDREIAFYRLEHVASEALEAGLPGVLAAAFGGNPRQFRILELVLSADHASSSWKGYFSNRHRDSVPVCLGPCDRIKSSIRHRFSASSRVGRDAWRRSSIGA
ncbi:MAG: hypothetical protein ACM3SX_21280 [Deltaproteobacteria bacterium]